MVHLSYKGQPPLAAASPYFFFSQHQTACLSLSEIWLARPSPSVRWCWPRGAAAVRVCDAFLPECAPKEVEPFAIKCRRALERRGFWREDTEWRFPDVASSAAEAGRRVVVWATEHAECNAAAARRGDPLLVTPDGDRRLTHPLIRERIQIVTVPTRLHTH